MRAEREAIARAGATAGRAVLISGVTVVVAMSGMLVAGGMFTSLAIGAMLVVAVAVIASATVLPAMLSVLGDKVEAIRLPFSKRRAARRGSVDGAWGRLAGHVRPPSAGLDARRRRRGRGAGPADVLDADRTARARVTAPQLRRGGRLPAADRRLPAGRHHRRRRRPGAGRSGRRPWTGRCAARCPLRPRPGRWPASTPRGSPPRPTAPCTCSPCPSRWSSPTRSSATRSTRSVPRSSRP